MGWDDDVQAQQRVSVPFSPWWSVLAAQQPKSSKTDLASLVSLAVLLALPLVVRFGRSAARILQNGPPQLFHWVGVGWGGGGMGWGEVR